MPSSMNNEESQPLWRRLRSKHACVVTLVGLMASACSDDPQEVLDASVGGPADAGAADVDAGVADAGPADTGVEVHDPGLLTAALAEEFCAGLESCTPNWLDLYVWDSAACRANTVAELLPTVASLFEGVDAGLVTFDRATFDRCLEDRREDACAPWPAEACMDAFSGTLRDGDECNHDLQCAGDSYCSAGRGTVACGLLPIFGPLQPWFCRNVVDSCGACEPYARGADDCGSRLCAPGNLCVSDGTNRICYPLGRPEGARCLTRSGGLCGSELSCVGPDALSASCVRMAREGEPCDPDPNPFEPRPLPSCTAGFSCIEGVCVAPSFGREGAACQTQEDCSAVPLYCDPSSEQCKQFPAAGEPCLQGFCRSDARCVDDRCEPLLGPGETCRSLGDCAPGYACLGLAPDTVCGVASASRVCAL